MSSASKTHNIVTRYNLVFDSCRSCVITSTKRRLWSECTGGIKCSSVLKQAFCSQTRCQSHECMSCLWIILIHFYEWQLQLWSSYLRLTVSSDEGRIMYQTCDFCAYKWSTRRGLSSSAALSILLVTIQPSYTVPAEYTSAASSLLTQPSTWRHYSLSLTLWIYFKYDGLFNLRDTRDRTRKPFTNSNKQPNMKVCELSLAH